MTGLARSERTAVALWLLFGAIAWNGLYDVLLKMSTRQYLYRHALHEAGRGPAVDLSQAMAVAVRDAAWLSTLWASLMLLLAMVTLRLIRNSAVQIR
jgi:hypothetical protein